MRAANEHGALGAWLGLLIVAALFCAPLFVGLDGWDLRSDEAIYSYSVDRILETGEWLTPKSIQVDGPFLEKPPLKFWIIAAAMRAGLLARDEFGYRFLDALMGAVAFIYIYWFGVRLSGAVCGVVAVLMTFSMDSIVFEHGIRSNNMEAPLLLAYCGGAYHLMRWIDNQPRSLAHALGVAAYFVLGFMTKFVAALFLPLICGVAFAVIPNARARLRIRSRDWIWASLVAAVAIVPWFAYESMVYERMFWDTILGLHVYTRFTSSLDPTHLQPWYFYFTRTWAELLYSGGRFIAAAAVVNLGVRAWQGRPWQTRLLLAWWLVPFAAISLGTSKLFHYAYPFLPPIAIGVGFLAGEVMAIAEGPWGAALSARLAAARLSASGAGPARRVLRVLLAVGAVAAIAVAIMTGVTGRISWQVGAIRILTNSSVVRPLLIAALLSALAGFGGLSVRVLAAIALAIALPVSNYALKVSRVSTIDDRLRVVRDCAQRVHAANPDVATGVYNAARGRSNHSHYYYLFRLGPWEEPETASLAEVQKRLSAAGEQTLVLMPVTEYEALKPQLSTEAGVPPPVVVDGIAIVTPGPYRQCAHAAQPTR